MKFLKVALVLTLLGAVGAIPAVGPPLAGAGTIAVVIVLIRRRRLKSRPPVV